ncbi:dynein axonemal assembly factor 3 [Neocloeon triangulifer]|uniref:dynein axonemal assembly factor 3 n=1 Tax=Neocloeon triangulifer TaxID=2078957 RepID=UPI00286FACFA|nr:dynein axonemal assembly factor 3 [Neocloeon triangulifer]
MMWGFSPSFDIQDELDNCPPSIQKAATVNVLLVGVGDLRHVLRTIAQSYRHRSNRHLNMHVLESSLEATARQLLLLNLALEPADVLNPLQKARMFLEIHGNTLVRPNTQQYIRQKASQLIYMVTDHIYLKNRLPMVSLENLKYKEKDCMEATYKFWKNSTIDYFDITKLWDLRLRAHLGQRYDSRDNVFDWDYHMKLSYSAEHGLPVTHQEYLNWRQTGVAFRWMNSAECTDVNLTMATGVVSEPNQRPTQFSGDMLTGPFISFGVDCEDPEMLKKCNNKFVRTATEVSEHNVTRLMYELSFKKSYDFEDGFVDDWGAVYMTSPTPSRMSSARSISREDSGYFRSPAREEYSSLIVDDMEVVFLSPTTLDEDRPSSKFRGTFNVIILGHSVVPDMVTQSLLSLAADDALFLIEGKKYVVGPRRCDLKDYKENFIEHIKDLQLDPLPYTTEYDPITDGIMRYLFNRRNVQ